MKRAPSARVSIVRSTNRWRPEGRDPTSLFSLFTHFTICAICTLLDCVIIHSIEAGTVQASKHEVREVIEASGAMPQSGERFAVYIVEGE